MIRFGFILCIIIFSSRHTSAQTAGRISFDSIFNFKWVIDTVEFIKNEVSGQTIHLTKENTDTIANYTIIEKWVPDKPLPGVQSLQVFTYKIENHIPMLTMVREQYIIGLNEKEEIGCELRYRPELRSTVFTIDTFYNKAFCDHFRVEREKSIANNNSYYCGTAVAEITFHCIRFIMGDTISHQIAQETVMSWRSDNRGSE